MFKIKTYEEMNKLPLSKKYEYAAYWQAQLEDGKELEFLSSAGEYYNVSVCSEKGIVVLDNIYRLKPQPTYAERQAEWVAKNGIKVGSKVKVTRQSAVLYEDGWTCSWQDEMDKYVGLVYKVKEFDNSGIRIEGWYFPYFVLEPVPEPEMVDLDFSDYLDIVHQWLIDTRTGEKCFINNIGSDMTLHVDYGYKSSWVPFSDLRKHYTYANGRRLEKEKQQICYKTNEPCKYDCQGLCKESC